MLQSLRTTPVEAPTLTARQYWTLQFTGWTAVAVISFFSLTIWYNPGELQPAVHTALQSVLGLMISHPLHLLASAAWTAPVRKRLLLNIIGIFAASIAWTVLRVVSYTGLTGDVISAEDWGGWIFGSVMIFFAWSFSYHALRFYRQAADQKELALAAQKQALEQRARAREAEFRQVQTEAEFNLAKIRMLKYQLNPHFLFNALNSVTYLVRKNDKERAVAMLGKIGNFLRTTLDEDDSLEHSLSEEIGVVNLYLDIERERFGERLHTEFFIDDGICEVNVPAYLLQPLCENVLKHAVGASLDQVTIRLTARAAAGRLELIVADNGPGFRQAELLSQSSQGIGLRNVRDRLASVIGDDFDMTLRNGQPRGAVVTISLPLKPSLENAPSGSAAMPLGA